MYVTMQKIVDDVLEGCGVDNCCAIPTTDNLFVVREAPKVFAKEAMWCRSYVAKVLYIAKRVKPECHLESRGIRRRRSRKGSTTAWIHSENADCGRVLPDRV